MASSLFKATLFSVIVPASVSGVRLRAGAKSRELGALFARRAPFTVDIPVKSFVQALYTRERSGGELVENRLLETRSGNKWNEWTATEDIDFFNSGFSAEEGSDLFDLLNVKIVADEDVRFVKAGDVISLTVQSGDEGEILPSTVGAPTRNHAGFTAWRVFQILESSDPAAEVDKIASIEEKRKSVSHLRKLAAVLNIDRGGRGIGAGERQDPIVLKMKIARRVGGDGSDSAAVSSGKKRKRVQFGNVSEKRHSPVVFFADDAVAEEEVRTAEGGSAAAVAGEAGLKMETEEEGTGFYIGDGEQSSSMIEEADEQAELREVREYQEYKRLVRVFPVMVGEKIQALRSVVPGVGKTQPRLQLKAPVQPTEEESRLKFQKRGAERAQRRVELAEPGSIEALEQRTQRLRTGSISAMSGDTQSAAGGPGALSFNLPTFNIGSPQPQTKAATGAAPVQPATFSVPTFNVPIGVPLASPHSPITGSGGNVFYANTPKKSSFGCESLAECASPEPAPSCASPEPVAMDRDSTNPGIHLAANVATPPVGPVKIAVPLLNFDLATAVGMQQQQTSVETANASAAAHASTSAVSVAAPVIIPAARLSPPPVPFGGANISPLSPKKIPLQAQHPRSISCTDLKGYSEQAPGMAFQLLARSMAKRPISPSCRQQAQGTPAPTPVNSPRTSARTNMLRSRSLGDMARTRGESREGIESC